MKLARNVFFGLVMAGTIVFLSSVSFAQMAPAEGKDSSAWKAKREDRIKLLHDSAEALQQTNPDLAKKLSNIVDEAMNGSKQGLEGRKDKVAKDSPEWKARREVRIQLFKDATAALQQSHPDLAKSLEEITVVKNKTEMQKMNEEKNEKENDTLEAIDRIGQ